MSTDDPDDITPPARLGITWGCAAESKALRPWGFDVNAEPRTALGGAAPS
jgi:hypothetical protein